MKKAILLVLSVIPMVAAAQRGGNGAFTFDTIRRVPAAERRLFTIDGLEEKKAAAGTATRAAGVRRTAAATGTTAADIDRERGRWTLGGGFGMSFGDYTSITVSPQVSYRFSDYFSLGGALSYNYYESRYDDYTLNYMGLGLTARLYPVSYVSVFVQPELHRRWGRVRDTRNRSELFAAMLVGAGAVFPMGEGNSMTVDFYYDVVQSPYTPYGNRIGYSVGYSFAW